MDNKNFSSNHSPVEQHHRPFCWIRVNQYLEFLIRSSLNAQTPAPVNYDINNIHQPHKIIPDNEKCRTYSCGGNKDSQPKLNHTTILENKNRSHTPVYNKNDPFIFKRPKTPPIDINK